MRVIIKEKTWVFAQDQLQPLVKMKMHFWKKQPLKQPPLIFLFVLSLPLFSDSYCTVLEMSSTHTKKNQQQQKKPTLDRGKGLDEARISLVAFSSNSTRQIFKHVQRDRKNIMNLQDPSHSSGIANSWRVLLHPHLHLTPSPPKNSLIQIPGMISLCNQYFSMSL